MRSILIIFATIVLIACGFFAYLWFQPAVTTSTSSNTSNGTSTTAPAAPMIAPASRPTEIPDPERVGGAGVSENIYVKVPDEKTGALATEFRAKRFGRDLGEHRTSAGAQILRAGEQVDRRVLVDAHDGV